MSVNSMLLLCIGTFNVLEKRILLKLIKRVYENKKAKMYMYVYCPLIIIFG